MYFIQAHFYPCVEFVRYHSAVVGDVISFAMTTCSPGLNFTFTIRLYIRLYIRVGVNYIVQIFEYDF